MVTAPSLYLQCQGLSKTYGEGNASSRALRGVDLEVHAGEMLMIEGPSGCGKTSLLFILAGLLRRDGGVCAVLGKDFDQMGRREAALFRRTNFGFVFQGFNLIPALTAAENAAVPLLLAGTLRRTAVERAERLLQSMGFDRRMTGALPAQLSGGQQQRVAIARALVHEPKLVVCDEPTSALDKESGKVVMELLRRQAVAHDRTTLVVTHDERILSFGDRVARMEDGRVVRMEQL